MRIFNNILLRLFSLTVVSFVLLISSAYSEYNESIASFEASDKYMSIREKIREISADSRNINGQERDQEYTPLTYPYGSTYPAIGLFMNSEQGLGLYYEFYSSPGFSVTIKAGALDSQLSGYTLSLLSHQKNYLFMDHWLYKGIEIGMFDRFIAGLPFGIKSSGSFSDSFLEVLPAIAANGKSFLILRLGVGWNSKHICENPFPAPILPFYYH